MYNAIAKQVLFCVAFATILQGATPAAPLSPSNSGRPATRPASREATTPAAMQLATTVYKEMLDQYMNGDWDALDSRLTRQTAIIGNMSAAQRADITYIRQAMGEGHPAWWHKVQAANAMTFQASLWKQTATVNFKSDTETKFTRTIENGGFHFLVQWPAENMENTGPLGDTYVTRDELANRIWHYLEFARIIGRVNPMAAAKLNPEQSKKFNDFLIFRGLLTASYYGPPRARERTFLTGVNSLFQEADEPNKASNRPFGSALLIEFALHSERYPSIAFPKSVQGLDQGDADESTLALALSWGFGRQRLTFAEDKALREFVRTFAEANGNDTGGVITLPNKLTSDLDPERDAPLASKRFEWLRTKLSAPPSSRPAPATAPSRRIMPVPPG